VFDGLFYINIPRLSHNGMENPRTTIKKLLHSAESQACSDVSDKSDALNTFERELK